MNREKNEERKKKNNENYYFLAKHVFLAKSEFKKIIQVLLGSSNCQHFCTMFHYLKIV
jgi:hypothetical protein